MPKVISELDSKTECFHCGESCADTQIISRDKIFCCDGCKMVYEIINQNGLCEYYDITKTPGLTQKTKIRAGKFAFLDDQTVQQKLIHFSDGSFQQITFYLPQMHCSSCIWILEHLVKLNLGISKSQVNFLKKEVTVLYNSEQISLRKVAELLTNFGYEPHISLNDLKSSSIKKYDRSKILKIGVAGFCFGNIMMLSFPEYFASGDILEEDLKITFSYLNLVLALPVFFYSATEFFISGFKGLRQKFLNIDLPIALAIFITFSRSIYEIITQTGAGYLDSMSGIVFFMLLGRYFQNKTYDTLSFDRDYTSYFPLAVTKFNQDGSETQIPVSDLKVGDRVKIHSHEIIPADGILFLGKANIDYSFVTGESLPVEKSIGEILYAGGRQTAGSIELEVVKEVSQSYLTQLWNNHVFKEEKEEKNKSFIHFVSQYFTIALFSIAITSAIYWSFNDPIKVWSSVTAILIVACPCALLLSSTFTNGNMLSILQDFKFFVKNENALERISKTNVIVFDKTGTITQSTQNGISFVGQELSDEQKQLITSAASQSSHPLSKAIVSFLPFYKKRLVKEFKELKGQGSECLIHDNFIKIGSAEFISNKKSDFSNDGSKVYVSINDEILGCFIIKSQYRSELKQVIQDLKKHYSLALISGDNNSELENLKKIFDQDADLLFEQKPIDKLNYIKSLQNQGKRVIMVGDGLNDAGALQQSDVGIAITDDINNFSPGCDVIFDGKQFGLLHRILMYCKKEKNIIYGSFIISILYNIVGLYFAVQGDLSPVIAAILMPISSISIVLFTTGLSKYYSSLIKN
jgi:Cu+-exporting ATPase